MKYILVTVYLATSPGIINGDEISFMRINTLETMYTSEECVEIGEIMKQSAAPEMKFAYECIGIPDDGWF